MDALITRLITKKIKATSSQLGQIVDYVAVAPFATDLLQADVALWGSFWHFDVIAPGYTLPAVELNLLRGIRLDGNWPESTGVEQYLANLQTAIKHPQAGVWVLLVAQQPCVVFAAPTSIQNLKLITVVWYCASTERLHAGYRTTAQALHFTNAVEQRSPGFEIQKLEPSKNSALDWLVLIEEQTQMTEAGTLAAKIDIEILRLRGQNWGNTQPRSDN